VAVTLRGYARPPRRELDWAPSKSFEQIVNEMVQSDLRSLQEGGR
jgi:GDP-D-mannose dehydratase